MGVVKNRYFKNTMGLFAELAIAKAVDGSGTAVAEQDSTVTIPVTVAGSPVAADTITFVISGANGGTINYIVPATPTTAIINAGIINAFANAGYAVNSTGTTSQVLTVSKPGALFNGVTVTLSKTGTSFTVAGPYTFAGGVNQVSLAQPNYPAFITNALAGAIWAFWDDGDPQLALVTGDTKNPANAKRKFFYAWKQADGSVFKTTSIPVSGLVYTSAAYAAGIDEIATADYSGAATWSVSQILHIKIIETTATNIPYPSYEYISVIGAGGIGVACTDLTAQINAETQDRIVGATTSGNVITITGLDPTRTFKLASYLEVSPGFPTDLSNIVLTVTTGASAAIGDLASVQELQNYFIENNGAVIYTNGGVTGAEFGQPASNLDLTGATHYGTLLVSSVRVEDGSVDAKYYKKGYAVITVVTGDEAKLAAL